jgi:hypothetical protein
MSYQQSPVSFTYPFILQLSVHFYTHLYIIYLCLFIYALIFHLSITYSFVRIYAYFVNKFVS